MLGILSGEGYDDLQNSITCSAYNVYILAMLSFTKLQSHVLEWYIN